MTPEHQTELLIAIIAGIVPTIFFAIFNALQKYTVEKIAAKVTATIAADVDAIKKQVTPNGGNTAMLGDRVVRLEESSRQKAEAIDILKTDVGELNKTQLHQTEMLEEITDHLQIKRRDTK